MKQMFRVAWDLLDESLPHFPGLPPRPGILKI